MTTRLQIGDQPFRFRRISALDVDEDILSRKCSQCLVQGWHHPAAFAPEWKGLSTVGSVANADVKSPQIYHRLLACDAAAVGPAFERPVVKHRNLAIGRGMDVHLDCTR